MTQYTKKAKKQTSQESNTCIRPKFPNAQVYGTGVPILSLTMHLFIISIDEHVPLKFPMTKKLSKIPKIYRLFNGTFRILEI